MNILINCSNIKIGGGLQVGHSFLEVIKYEKKINFVVVLSDEIKSLIDLENYPNNFKFINYNVRGRFLGALTGRNAKLSKIESDYSIDRVFTIFGPSYWKPRAPHIVGFAKAQYIYKDSPFFKRIGFVDKLKLCVKNKIHMRDFGRNSNILISENEDVSARLSALLNKKVYTVSNTYNQVFDSNELWDKERKLLDFDGDYILCIAANYPHKNLEIIPKVIDKMIIGNIKKFKFILTIKEHELEGYLPRHADYIVFLGKVSVEECPWLYMQSRYVFMPTLLECFTATYPEAMKMKKVILTSDLFFAQAICQKAAMYFDPLDPESIVETLMHLDSNKPLYTKLIKLGEERLSAFETAESRARKYIEIIKENKFK